MSGEAGEEEENAAELKLGKAFQDAHVLTNSEVAILLEQHLAIKKRMDPNYRVHPMLEKTQQYVSTFSSIKNAETASQARELLSNHNLTEFELGAVANLAPETAEEAKVLVPSLTDTARFTDESIQSMLDDLATYKRFE